MYDIIIYVFEYGIMSKCMLVSVIYFIFNQRVYFGI